MVNVFNQLYITSKTERFSFKSGRAMQFAKLIKENYRIAGNFRGTKFSMITSFQLFANKFSRYIQVLSPIYYLKTISRFLFSRIGQNPRKPRNFCPSKISSYTVAYSVTVRISAQNNFIIKYGST